MDTKKIKQIIALFEDSSVASMDLEIDDIKIKLEKQATTIVNTAPQVQAVATNPKVETIAHDKNVNTEEVNMEYVKSPLVGTFYASASQGGKPFVEIGSKVNEGDVICIIEAMKVMNEIKAHRAGTICEIKVKDGDMVQFDEELIAIGE